MEGTKAELAMFIAERCLKGDGADVHFRVVVSFGEIETKVVLVLKKHAKDFI
jgi:hypothetical protein